MTLVEEGYDAVLTAGALNPMPDQEGNFLPQDLCLDLHFAIDILAKVRDAMKVVVDGEGG
jgi:hypothetical protein